MGWWTIPVWFIQTATHSFSKFKIHFPFYFKTVVTLEKLQGEYNDYSYWLVPPLLQPVFCVSRSLLWCQSGRNLPWLMGVIGLGLDKSVLLASLQVPPVPQGAWTAGSKWREACSGAQRADRAVLLQQNRSLHFPGLAIQINVTLQILSSRWLKNTHEISEWLQVTALASVGVLRALLSFLSYLFKQMLICQAPRVWWVFWIHWDKQPPSL